MLETIREGAKKPWIKIVIFAIIISFVFAGGFSASSLLGDPNAVAVVNGDSISVNEFQRALARQKSVQADFYKANVKTEEDEKNFQEDVLQQLISVKVAGQAVEEMGLRLSPAALREIIQSDQNYQVDGKYSSELVEQTLARAGMSRQAFKSAYENQSTLQQLSSGVFDSEFALAGEAAKDFALTGQKRSGKAVSINFEPFKQNQPVTDEEIATYYQSHLENYRLEEKVSVDFIELSVDELKKLQSPSEEQLKSYYDANLPRFQSETKKQFSHILVLSNGDDEAALAKINAISEKLNQGADFAELAKTESDDAPTRELGGDLGVLLEGALDEASETAVKLLENEGDMTPPVKLDYGYQLLKLTKLIPGETQTFDEVKEEITAQVAKHMAEEAFYAKADLLKEKAYEFSDSLQEAAEATGLEIKTSALFGRKGAKGVFANPDLINKAFSSDVLEAKLNSEAIEVSENQLLVLRLNSHQPSQIEALDDVKERIKNTLIAEKATALAESLAEQLIEKLGAGETVDELLAANQLAWVALDLVERNNASLSYMANQQFFKMAAPQPGQSSLDKVSDFRSVVVLVLNKVEPGDLSSAEETVKTQRQLYSRGFYANAGYESYIKDLRTSAEVKHNTSRLQ